MRNRCRDLLLAACVCAFSIVMAPPASANTIWKDSFNEAWQEEADKASHPVRAADAATPKAAASLSQEMGDYEPYLFFILYCILLGYIWLGRGLHVFGLLATLSLVALYDVKGCGGCIFGPGVTVVILALGYAWIMFAGRIVILNIQSGVERFRRKHSGVERLFDARPPVYIRENRIMSVGVGCFFLALIAMGPPFSHPLDVVILRHGSIDNPFLTGNAALAFNYTVIAVLMIFALLMFATACVKSGLILTEEGFEHFGLLHRSFCRWDNVLRFYPETVYTVRGKLGDMVFYDTRDSATPSHTEIYGRFTIPAEQLAHLMNHWREKAITAKKQL